MVTDNGARAMLRDDFGKVEVGKKADLITLKLDEPHIMPTDNIVKTIVTAAGPGDVRDSIINGKLVMRDRTVITMDEKKIINECTRRQKEIFSRAGI
jgi:5-methylthioadenosine/S-adenosylhomocysteine deaminase